MTYIDGTDVAIKGIKNVGTWAARTEFAIDEEGFDSSDDDPDTWAKSGKDVMDAWQAKHGLDR